MDDALAMRVVERVGDFTGDFQSLVERERPFLEARGQGLTLEMRHDQVARAIGAAHVEDSQMWGWSSAATARASRSKRACESRSSALSLGRTLIATVRSRRVSRAL
jgi:hypothetical protein